MRLQTGVTVTALCLTCLVAASPSVAQLGDNLSGLRDENVQGYLNPLQSGLSATLNSAIFRSGFVPTEGLTFSIGVAAMAAGFGDEDRTYSPTHPDGFTGLTATKVPTVIGDPGGGSVAGQSGLNLAYPGGFDLDGFEIAAPQLSIGAVVGTRVVIRYLAIDLGDSEIGHFSYFGMGAQHAISQWIETLPVDVAGGIFVHSFDIGDDVLQSSAYHLNLTASREFGYLQPYLGLGLDSIKSDVTYEHEDDPELSVDVAMERDSNAHLTLGVAAKAPGASAFFEFNAAAGVGFAFGLDFGI